jgi:arabinogalactan oligomer / maltooligosaccharide transport system permease protein
VTPANPAQAAPPAQTFKPALSARAIAAFSGTVGLTLKIVLLSVTNALAAWAGYILVDRGKWPAFAMLVLVTATVDWVYLSKRTLPLKFLVPGMLFLLAFQIVPILYTINVAFTNYSTGHVISKPDAITQIKLVSLQAPPNGQQYSMAPARDKHGNLVLILRDDSTGKNYVGTKDGLTPLPRGSVKEGALGIVAAPAAYKLVTGSALFGLDAQLRAYTVPTTGDSAIRPQGIGQAIELRPTLRYDPARGVFVRISDGKVFRDNGRGSFVSGAGVGAEELEPGWKTYIGWSNFRSIAKNPLVRQPFIRVFIWTIFFAAATVFISFAIGLFLAIALDKQGMRLQRLYRSILVLPYAIPGFLSLLVWAGLLNDQFGVVNRTFHLSIPWLFDANWAKVSCIIVSVWLTVPYFFLVSMGALQSIPAELIEAARVDGGGPWQRFRRVTLPLLLVATAPLLIASFAFNFNNFNVIFLLTGGGPAQGGSNVAGATDILISYTYKLAIATGKGNDYGLATAVSIIIFLLVATISGVAFWRTKALEQVR